VEVDDARHGRQGGLVCHVAMMPRSPVTRPRDAAWSGSVDEAGRVDDFEVPAGDDVELVQEVVVPAG